MRTPASLVRYIFMHMCIFTYNAKLFLLLHFTTRLEDYYISDTRRRAFVTVKLSLSDKVCVCVCVCGGGGGGG